MRRFALFSRPRLGLRVVAVLAATSCAAALLAVAGTAAASGSASAVAAKPPIRGPMPQGLVRTRAHAADLATARAPAAKRAHVVPVPQGPGVTAENPSTKTLYVATTGTISLINTARCNRLVTRGCRVVASVPVPGGLQYVLVDRASDTIYALLGGAIGAGHRVKLFNGARCNVRNRTDCNAVATATVGKFPIAASIDDATHTLYVSNNYSNTVSMINTATCNATQTAGCAAHVPAVAVGAGPNFSAVDRATRTIYVPNDGPGGTGGNIGSGGRTVSLINAATCNATRQTGCPAHAPTATVGNTPVGVTVAGGTVYASNGGSNTASLIEAATCNATNRASCHRAQPTARLGTSPGPGANDARTRTVYVVNTNDSTLSAISTAACNASHPAGCPATAPTLATGANPGFVTVDKATDTLYVANHFDNTVSVLNGAACNATRRRGCRRVPPTVAIGGPPGQADVDRATNTVYAANQLTGRVAVINGAICNAHRRRGCDQTPATVKVGKPGFTSNPFGVAVNQATDTVYVSNVGSGSNSTVKVINGAICNAAHTSGCHQAPASVNVGVFPGGMGIDQATDTIYVANSGSNTISVINGATCNGTHQSGCHNAPPTVTVSSPSNVAVDQATDTVYVTAANNTVAVINGATCNATKTSGCGQTPATVTVGSVPIGVAVDQATDTVYVANNANGDSPASVSVINGATCNGTVRSGCGHTPVTTPAGQAAFGVAVDQATDTIFVASFFDSSVTVIDGARCNAMHASGCSRVSPKKPVGSGPFWVAINQRTGTGYVSNFNDNNLSVIPTN